MHESELSEATPGSPIKILDHPAAAIAIAIAVRHVRMVNLSSEPLAQLEVSLVWRPSFISRRSCISRMGASFAISTTRRTLLASRRFDQESTSATTVLHRMERAESTEDAHAAAHAFLRWLEELDVLE